MKAPTLPIRLNRQLSGGYEPHLLEQTEKRSCEQQTNRRGKLTGGASHLMRGMSWMVQQDLGKPGRASSSVHVRL